MKKKRIWSLLMVLFLTAGFVQTPVQVKADNIQVESVTLTDDNRYNPEYYKEPKVYYPAAKKAMSRTAGEQTLEAHIVEALENLEESIDVSAFKIPSDRETASATFFQILNAHPELFYVGNSVSWYSNSQNIVTKYNISYIGTPDEIRQQREELETEAAKALAQVDTSLDAYQQALIVHDYLVQNCEYDYENYENKNVPDISHTAYGSLVNKMSVCDGYADAFAYIMENKLGISCDVVSSDAMAHAWNMIEIGGKWYHVDATWDDPTKDCIGRVAHNYFLLSDSKISDTEHKHSAWNQLHTANSTSYDNAFWADVTSAICYNNGTWYYSKYQPDNNDPSKAQAVKLVKKDGSGLLADGESTVYATSVWRMGNSYYPGSYMYLAKTDGKVYFNTSTEIYQITEDESAKKIYTPQDLSGNLIYGFTVRGIELWYAPQDQPSYEGYRQTIRKHELQKVTGISAENVTGNYTGQPYTITVEGLQQGDVVQYVGTDGKYHSAQPEMIDAGTYEVSYRVERDGYLSFNGKASVTINQADPEYEIPTGLIANSGSRLVDVQLPEGFTWQEPDTMLREVGSHNYLAEYTPEDIKNYRKVSVPLTVQVICPEHQYTDEVTKVPSETEKGLVTHTCIFCGHSYTEEIDITEMPQEITGISAENVAGTYTGQSYTITVKGTKEGDIVEYALKNDAGAQAEYRMEQPEMKNAGTYTVLYKVMRAGYQTFLGSARVEIARANPGYTVPSNLKGVIGAALSSIELPDGFIWQTSPDTILSKAGENAFYVCYRPADQVNYNIVTDIEIVINVECPGHQYVLEITAQPTETKKGLKTYTCKLCRKSYTEDIPMLAPTRPAKVSDLKVTKQTDTSLSFSWKQVSGVGFRLMLYQGNKVISTKNVTGNNCKYTKLKPATVYTLRVTPYRVVNGQNIYAISTGSVKTATAPAKAKLSTAKRSGKSKVKLTWKAVTGASGYEISMKTGNGKFKSIKLVGKKVSFTKTGLNKKNSYSFRIRAYVTVDKKKIYGTYSNVKKVK